MTINVNGNIISTSGFTTSSEIANTPMVVTNGLVLWLDAGNSASYINSSNYYDCGYGCQYYASNPGCTNCNAQIKDMSGYGNDGTFSGAVVQYSNVGGTIYFDKSNDYVDIGSSAVLSITTQISVFSWINLDNVGAWNGIFGAFSSGNFVHFQTAYTDLNIYVYGPAASWAGLDAGGLSSGVWVNLGFTFDGTTLKVFKNGVQYSTTATAASPGTNITTAGASLGRVYDISRSFGGNIAINLVYNRALTANEVIQNFDAGRQRFAI